MEQLIRNAAKREGVDLIGFAGKERFASVDAQHNPFSIFPEGKTVIMIGKRICRGSLRGVEEGTNFGDYRLFGLNWLEDEFLSLACYNVVRALENEGWEAVPLFPNPAELGPQGVSVAEGRPAPNVYPDFEYAAVACGIAEYGMSGILLTPEFGSRQRFHMIITDAEIPSSPLLEKKVCDGCGKCAAACPYGAIDTAHTKDIDICGKKMSVYEVDEAKCRTCENGACQNRFGATLKADRVAALCNRVCLSHLEETDALDNRFENAFRTREAWSVGGAKDEAARNTEAANVLGGSFSKDGNRGAR